MEEKILGIWKRRLRKFGDSYYLAIPPELVEASKIQIGDPLKLKLLDNGNLLIEKGGSS